MVKKIFKQYLDKKRKKTIQKQLRKYEIDNKEWLNKNSVFNDSTKREDCFIIGNGPSIQCFGFELLKDKDIFTVNQIARNNNFNKLNIKYHFWADPMFFYEDINHNKTISDDMYQQMISVVKNNKNVKCFVTCKIENGVVQSLIKEGANIHRYPSFLGTKQYGNSFKPSLDRPMPGFYNVLQYAILSAIAMGYKKVFLLGSEQTGLLNVLNTKINEKAEENGHGYSLNEDEKRRMVNHYNKFSVSQFLYEHALMFDDFEWLKMLAEKLNIGIYNCTPKTLVDSFEKKDIYEVLGSKKE